MSLSRKAKIIIGCCLVAIAVTVGGGSYLIYSAYSFLSQVRESVETEIPVELQEAKVFKGAEFLAKEEFFKQKHFTRAEIISESAAIADEKERYKFVSSQSAKNYSGYSDIKICGGEIVAVGTFGGQIFDVGGKLKSGFFFEPFVRQIKFLWWKQNNFLTTLNNLQIVDLDGDGKCEFFSRGSSDGFVVFDNRGNVVWRYGADYSATEDLFSRKKEADWEKKIYVLAAAIDDADGDGQVEYVVGRKNDGIHIFDKNGNEKSFQPDDYAGGKYVFTDVDDDGKTDFLEIIGNGTEIRDATGKSIKGYKLEPFYDEPLWSEDKNEKKVLQLFGIYKSKLVVTGFNRQTIIEADAPLSEVKIKPVEYNFPSSTPIPGNDGTTARPIESSNTKDREAIYEPRAVWVRLHKDKPKYLAIIGSFISFPRSNFYVYDEKGTLLYHELLPEEAETIAVVPAANSAERILIGGKDTIWKFTAK